MTRTPQEIHQLLAAHPRVAGVQFPNYADVNYLVLPVNLINIIYADSGIAQTFHWRSEIFDCKDFLFRELCADITNLPPQQVTTSHSRSRPPWQSMAMTGSVRM
jgi:hypothetical protein